MATYSLTFSWSTTSLLRSFALRAGIYGIKVTSVAVTGYSHFIPSTGSPSDTTSGRVFFNHYVGSTISGGTSITPQAMREGGLPASATAMYSTSTVASLPGTPISITGTALTLDTLYMTNTTPATWQAPSDLLIAPGSVLAIAPWDNTISGSGTTYGLIENLTFYFDEYHLARSK